MNSEDLAKVFPITLPDTTYLDQISSQLSPLGFTKDNTLPCLSVCRDEITSPFARKIQDIWGNYFSLGGLGGCMVAGKTEFQAAVNHSPMSGGKERFIFISMSHVGITEDFQAGKVKRYGQDHLDNACGALMALTDKINSGDVDQNVYGNDVEMGYVTRRLLKILPPEKKVDILDVTQAAHDAAKIDTEAFANEILNPEKVDWAMFTGIQLHMPQGEFIAPRSASAMVNGKTVELSLSV